MTKILKFILFYVITFNSYGQSFINTWGERGTTNQTRTSSLPELFASVGPNGKSIIYEKDISPDFVVTTSDGKKSNI